MFPLIEKHKLSLNYTYGKNQYYRLPVDFLAIRIRLDSCVFLFEYQIHMSTYKSTILANQPNLIYQL